MRRGVFLDGVLKAFLDERKDMTQEDLANATGILRTDMNAFIKGRRRVGDDRIARIAPVMGLSSEELRALGDEDTAQSQSLLGRLEAIAAMAEELVEGQRQIRGALEAQGVLPVQPRPVSRAEPKRRRTRA